MKRITALIMSKLSLLLLIQSAVSFTTSCSSGKGDSVPAYEASNPPDYSYFEVFAQDDDNTILSVANTEQVLDTTEPPATQPPTFPPATEPPSTSPPTEPPEVQTAGIGLLILKDRLAEKFTISSEHISKYTSAINKLYNECGKPDTYIITPPCAAQLYLPDKYINNTNDQYIAFDELASSVNGPKYIDLKDSFEKHKNEYIYFKTDHHWTALGAYYAYEAFINAIGMTPTKLSEYKSGSKSGFKGSLYTALSSYPQYESFNNLSDDVSYYIPKHNAKVISYQSADLIDGQERLLINPNYSDSSNLYNIFLGGDIPIGYIHSDIGNGKSIMVIRDSYGHAFLPFLVDNFEYIYSVEPRYFKPSFFGKTANIIILSTFLQEKQIDTLLFLNYSLSATSGYWLAWGDELQKLSGDYTQ